MIKYLDFTGLNTFWEKIKSTINTGLDKKVDKETGKGLSTNDYTTVEKTKLSNIEDGATKVTWKTIE